MNGNWNILVSESRDFAPEARQLLGSIGRVQWEDLTREELPAHLREADVLWVRLRSRIDAGILEAAPHLKIIASPTTGLNHIDMEAALARQIRVLSLRGERQFLRSIRATAEHTIGLILSLLRHVPAAVEHVRGRGWNRDLFRGSELYGRNVGIVGYGRLGPIVAQYLSAFECTVSVCDPFVRREDVAAPARLVGLDELLATSDVVTVHVDLNPNTQNLFGAGEFRRMRPGAFFINTSRGELVDEAALLEALESGQLGGAALDVICREHKYEDSPLIEWARSHSNLIITPHIGGCTSESMARSEVFLAGRLREMVSVMETEN